MLYVFFWMFIMINNIPNLSIPSVLLHIITYGPILFVLSFSRFQYLVQIKGVIFLAFFVYFFHYTLDRVYLFDIIELLIVPVILVLSYEMISIIYCYILQLLYILLTVLFHYMSIIIRLIYSIQNLPILIDSDHLEFGGILFIMHLSMVDACFLL